MGVILLACTLLSSLLAQQWVELGHEVYSASAKEDVSQAVPYIEVEARVL